MALTYMHLAGCACPQPNLPTPVSGLQTMATTWTQQLLRMCGGA